MIGRCQRMCACVRVCVCQRGGENERNERQRDIDTRDTNTIRHTDKSVAKRNQCKPSMSTIASHIHIVNTATNHIQIESIAKHRQMRTRAIAFIERVLLFIQRNRNYLMLTLNDRVRIITLHRHIFGVVSPGFFCVQCVFYHLLF